VAPKPEEPKLLRFGEKVKPFLKLPVNSADRKNRAAPSKEGIIAALPLRPKGPADF
jgi:hypothetical protein